jgi:hypothetical protein
LRWVASGEMDDVLSLTLGYYPFRLACSSLALIARRLPTPLHPLPRRYILPCSLRTTLSPFPPQRHKLKPPLTPVTPESFAAWKKNRIEKKAAEQEALEKAKASARAAGKMTGMTGKDMFEFGGELYEDDEEGYDEDWDISRMLARYVSGHGVKGLWSFDFACCSLYYRIWSTRSVYWIAAGLAESVLTRRRGRTSRGPRGMTTSRTPACGETMTTGWTKRQQESTVWPWMRRHEPGERERMLSWHHNQVLMWFQVHGCMLQSLVNLVLDCGLRTRCRDGVGFLVHGLEPWSCGTSSM